MVPSIRFCDRTSVSPVFKEREAPGAVGRFQHARRETGLPQGRRLLVAGNTQNGYRSPEERRIGKPEVSRAILYLGQQLSSVCSEAADLGIPPPFADVVKQRPRGIGGIRHMGRAAGHLPDQPASTVPKATSPASARARRPSHCRATTQVWTPRNTGRATVPSSPCTMASCPSASALRRKRWCGGPADDGVMHGRAGFTVPDHDGFALVGMPMAAMSVALTPPFSIAPATGGDDGLPDLVRIMLDPARGRVMAG